MDVRVGPLRKLSTEELMLLNYGVGEESCPAFGKWILYPCITWEAKDLTNLGIGQVCDKQMSLSPLRPCI